VKKFGGGSATGAAQGSSSVSVADQQHAVAQNDRSKR